MTSQEPKTKSKKSQKSPGKTCWCSSPLKRYKCWSVTGGAFLLETLVLQSLRTSPFYWRLRGRGSLNLENSLKVLRELLFLGSVLTVYQTATSKIITYLSWGEGLLLCLASSSGVLWHHLQGEIGLKIKMHSLEECHWSENQVVFSLSCSVRPITFPCFWNSELNYNILEDAWGVKGTLKCLKTRKRSQRMFFALSTC